MIKASEERKNLKPYLFILVFALARHVAAQPYQPQVIWDRSGETDNSWYGRQILALGDQNDDGFADWAVHSGFEQSLEFYHGAVTLPLEPYHVFHLDTATYLGFNADMIGDVNGDGYADWLLTQTRRPSGVEHGIFLGGPAINDTPDVLFATHQSAYFLGDFNGDGFDDVYFWDTGNVARICYGGSPMDTTVDWVLQQPPPGIIQPIPRAVGDFNGDGSSDFMCYNPNPTYNIAIFLGGANPDTIPAYFWTDMTRPKAGIDSLNGDHADEFVRGGPHVHFGRPVLSPFPDATLNAIASLYAANGGDFNGDGCNDLIMYTWSTIDNIFGALTLHLGHPWLNPNPVFTIEGDTPPLYLRGIYTAVGLGDVNGDRLGDIAIGVWNETFWRRGRCVILSGDTLRVSADPTRFPLPRDIEISVYPNPFNSTATVELTLPWSERLNEMTIYNTLGQIVRHVTLPPFVGQVTYGFEARDLSSGFYLLEVRSGTLSKTQKLFLVR